mmetsp:Transcript_50845/g.142924  ORF Transcript_50845/g.142924 Transcript_50845/m.142924 type:complete len:92 (-) Transcript_50845:470-745(-)
MGDNLKGRLHAADHVLECFDDDDLIRITCGVKSSVFLYDYADGWACTSGLPTLLYNKLNGRQHMLPKAKYPRIDTTSVLKMENPNGSVVRR